MQRSINLPVDGGLFLVNFDPANNGKCPKKWSFFSPLPLGQVNLPETIGKIFKNRKTKRQMPEHRIFGHRRTPSFRNFLAQNGTPMTGPNHLSALFRTANFFFSTRRKKCLPHDGVNSFGPVLGVCPVLQKWTKNAIFYVGFSKILRLGLAHATLMTNLPAGGWIDF